MTTINLTLDDTLLSEAQEVAQGNSLSEVMTAALKAYIKRQKMEQPSNTVARRERILSFAGSWADMPQEEWEDLQQILRQRNNFFPEQDISW